MNSNAIGLRTAATIFGIVCIIQVIRLVTHANVVVNGHAIPLWPSAFAALVAGGLSFWLWRLGGPPAAPGDNRTTLA